MKPEHRTLSQAGVQMLYKLQENRNRPSRGNSHRTIPLDGSSSNTRRTGTTSTFLSYPEGYDCHSTQYGLRYPCWWSESAECVHTPTNYGITSQGITATKDATNVQLDLNDHNFAEISPEAPNKWCFEITSGRIRPNSPQRSSGSWELRFLYILLFFALSLCDFHAFGTLQEIAIGRRFGKCEEAGKIVKAWIVPRPPPSRKDGITDRPNADRMLYEWRLCVSIRTELVSINKYGVSSLLTNTETFVNHLHTRI